MKLDGPFGKVQLAGYLLIGEISIYTIQHLPFSFGKFLSYTDRIEQLRRLRRSFVANNTVHFSKNN